MEKRMSEMIREEQAARRAYNREQKQKSRARQGEKIPEADESMGVFLTNPQRSELRSRTKQFAETVARELDTPTAAELEVLHQVAWTVFSFRDNLIRRVKSPTGELIGGMYFADVLGRLIVPDTRKFNLEKSQTYSAAYRELLKILDRRYGQNVSSADLSESLSAIAVRQELQGAK